MRQLAIYQAPILGRLFFFNPPPPASPNAFQASQLFRNCALASDLLPNLPSFIRRVCSGFALVWGVLQGRHPTRVRHRTGDGERPEPTQVIRATSGLIDPANCPFAAVDGVLLPV